MQAVLFLGDIFTGQQHADGGSIGAGAADAFFFHRFNQSGLGESGRRLGKVLRRLQLLAVQRAARGQLRQRLAILLSVSLVAAFQVEGAEAGELEHRAGGPEVKDPARPGRRFGFGCGRGRGIARASGIDINRGGIGARVGHLAGQHPRPDYVIKPVLVGGQVGLKRRRIPFYRGRPDGFVGLLRRFGPGAMDPGLVRQVSLAVLGRNVFPGFLHRRLGHLDRVGAHIGNQTYRAFAAHGQTFIELLGHRHGSLGGEPELPARLLLQSAGGKGGRGTLPYLPFAHVGHRIDGILQLRLILAGLRFDTDVQPVAAALDRVQRSGKQLRPVGRIGLLVQQCVQGPGFHRHEVQDIPLPVGDQPQGHRLDASGGKAPLYPLAEERANLVAHQPVQDAAGLLGIHQLHINFPGMLKGFFHGVFSDLVEDYPLGRFCLFVPAGGGLEVPGYGLALPVRVGSQVDIGGLIAGPLQLLYQRHFVPHRDVRRGKILF